MKTHLAHIMKLAALSAALSITPFALADEIAPTPPTPPDSKDVIIVRPDLPAVFTNQAVAEMANARHAKMEKAAYLGVGASAAPDVLTEQLKLPRGVGLVVEFVEKESPAEAAGLQPRDVLHKLNDQLLINLQQFATLVRTFKPGDSVKLTVVRKGEVITLDAKLVEKELPELSSAMHTFEFNASTPLMPGFGSNLPMQMRIEAHANDNDDANADDGKGQHQIKARVIRVMPGSTSKIIKIDDGLRIELENRDGKKSLNIQDKDGKSLFEGPYNTPPEMEKLPAELREKVKALEEGIELKEVPATAPAQPKADADTLLPGGPAT